jgi:hypothetical protein
MTNTRPSALPAELLEALPIEAANEGAMLTLLADNQQWAEAIAAVVETGDYALRQL